MEYSEDFIEWLNGKFEEVECPECNNIDKILISDLEKEIHCQICYNKYFLNNKE